MKTKHFNIPIFIPQEACPNQCIFCDQKKISGASSAPDPVEVRAIIEKHLKTIPQGSNIEIAFFGGTFTGLPLIKQEEYLKSAKPYIEKNIVKGIRLSTRPDYIDQNIIDLLKSMGVTAVELGIQSIDDNVLKLAGRGHSSSDIYRAAKMLKDAGFSLGMQMMIGLPGDSPEISEKTAREIVMLGADFTRIYPVLVIKDTKLEKLYINGIYNPLSIEEAVSRSVPLVKLFESAGIRIIRLGLHPSEDLLSGKSLIAGPFHTSLKELVISEIWKEILQPYTEKDCQEILISVSPEELNFAIGYKGQNKKMLSKKFRKVMFIKDLSLKNREFNVHYN